MLGPLGWDTVISELGQPLGRALLAPHRPYLREVEALWDAGVSIRAIAHITGGGFVGNVPRVLPESVGVRLRTSAWEVPALFRLIQREGQVRDEEMYRTYNMGIGLVLVITADEVNRAITALPELVVIGETTSYDGTGPRVRLDL